MTTATVDARRWVRAENLIYVQVPQTVGVDTIWRTVAWARGTGAGWRCRPARSSASTVLATTAADAERVLDRLTTRWAVPR